MYRGEHESTLLSGRSFVCCRRSCLCEETGRKVRVLAFRHLHTDERLAVTYGIGDRYQRGALQEINHFFRDFRTGDRSQSIRRLLDLLYDIKIDSATPMPASTS
jgi:uncharacterized protein YcbK (DUF882 family)